ncbi:NUDIX domain-containing protein [Actinoplanes sp. NPDC051513]|uniref:NUDIX domain-containing protein n=1 Tax=Actinoplanes sp. NPDC051513 TaxID=3363908 RepID=UPI00379A979F
MTSDVPLFERDPDAWRERLAEGNRSQPRKRVSADVLFSDAAGRALLVDPVYKPDWDLPGGVVGADEAPIEAARREIVEELGIVPVVGRLLVVDWVAPHQPWDDLLAFVFDGGVLGEEQLASIRLQQGELRAYRMVAQAEAPGLLRDYVARRLVRAMASRDEGGTAYLHDGERAA